MDSKSPGHVKTFIVLEGAEGPPCQRNVNQHITVVLPSETSLGLHLSKIYIPTDSKKNKIDGVGE